LIAAGWGTACLGAGEDGVVGLELGGVEVGVYCQSNVANKLGELVGLEDCEMAVVVGASDCSAGCVAWCVFVGLGITGPSLQSTRSAVVCF
jgi:hypothetical protein